MDYKILGIPAAFIIYIIFRVLQKVDLDKIVGKIIGKERLEKILNRADLLFGFKKRKQDGSLKEHTPVWVKFLIVVMYLMLIILGGGAIIGLVYFLFFEK